MWLDQKNRSLVSLSHFTRNDFLGIFQLANEIQRLQTYRRTDLCKARTLATVFFQPSTRTRLSFEAAMLFVGGSYISFGHPEMTKASAGESLEDTVRVLDGYADILAIRHPRDEAAAIAANLVAVPIINAGCGTLEHPTQALLDLYAIYVAFGAIDGLTIGLMGDLRLQRSVNSLVMALSNFDVTLHLISHPSRNLRPETARYLHNSVEYHETDSLGDILPTLDVLYIIRIDRDRTSGPEDYSSLRADRGLEARHLSAAKHSLLILNPLPRDDELHPDVDATSHAFYFQQAHLGRPLRAALLAMMLGRAPL